MTKTTLTGRAQGSLNLHIVTLPLLCHWISLTKLNFSPSFDTKLASLWQQKTNSNYSRADLKIQINQWILWQSFGYSIDQSQTSERLNVSSLKIFDKRVKSRLLRRNHPEWFWSLWLHKMAGQSLQTNRKYLL